MSITKDVAGSEAPPQTQPYYVYSLKCLSPFHLYIGQTNDLDRRFREHLKDPTVFIKCHGTTGEITILKTVNGRDEAIHWETLEYIRHKKLGYIVGGVNHFQDFYTRVIPNSHLTRGPIWP